MPRGLIVPAPAVGALLALALAGCAALPPVHEAATFPLLPPASLGTRLARQQVLQLAAGATTATIHCVVNVTPDAIVLVGLGPIGQRAFTLTVDAAGLRIETAAGARGLPDPARILADLQMALWPHPVLEVATAGTAWEVLEPQPGVRRVLRAGRAYAEIRHDAPNPWDGRLWLVNFADDYSLAIESRPLGG